MKTNKWGKKKIKFQLVNKANLVHNFSYYVYFFSLHVLGDYVPIIRRNNCTCVTLGICHSVYMTVWNAGCDTKCRIGTVISPDDRQIVA